MIASKTLECVFDPETGTTINKDIPPERQTKSSLTDEELHELARQGKRIEEYFGVPQDIEWAIDQDLPFPENVLFVQARPETIWSKKETRSVLETKTEFGEYDIFSVLKKDWTVQPQRHKGTKPALARLSWLEKCKHDSREL